MARLIALALLNFGLALHSYIALFKTDGGLTGFVVGLWAWSLAPYAAGALLLWGLRNIAAAVGWLILPAIMDAGDYYSVFIHPKHSTAALGLLFIPLWNLILFGPAGGFVGWLIGRKAHKAGIPSDKALKQTWK